MSPDETWNRTIRKTAVAKKPNNALRIESGAVVLCPECAKDTVREERSRMEVRKVGVFMVGTRVSRRRWEHNL